MPKIIENLPLRLAEEARKQTLESGYSALTIRSVAAACGVGTGTVYNYYPSKDALVAAFLLEDWTDRLHAITAYSEQSADRTAVLRFVHETLADFLQQYASVFQDKGAASAFSGSFSRYHALLRSQLAKPLRPFCSTDFAADFITEAILTWTVNGTAFEALNEILKNIQ